MSINLGSTVRDANFLLLQIYVYYDVQLSSMRAKSFIPEHFTATKENPRQAQLLIEWCLYGQ